MSDQTITGFLTAAKENEADAVAHHADLLKLLDKVDDKFRALMNPCADDNPLCRIMVMNAHAYFLAAVRIALTGQAPPVFTTLRGSLECAFYALIVQEIPGSDLIWINRYADKKACRTTFVPSKAIRLLDFDRNLASLAQESYDLLIDFGAHPNLRTVTDNLRVNEVPEGTRITLTYLQMFDSLPVARSLLACFETGIVAVLLFTQVFRHTEEAQAIHASASELWTDLTKYLKEGDYEIRR